MSCFAFLSVVYHLMASGIFPYSKERVPEAHDASKFLRRILLLNVSLLHSLAFFSSCCAVLSAPLDLEGDP